MLQDQKNEKSLWTVRGRTFYTEPKLSYLHISTKHKTEHDPGSSDRHMGLWVYREQFQPLWAKMGEILLVYASKVTHVGSVLSQIFNHANGMALWKDLSVGPPHWSRLKYLNNHWIDNHENIYICTKFVQNLYISRWIVLTCRSDENF